MPTERKERWTWRGGRQGGAFRREPGRCGRGGGAGRGHAPRRARGGGPGRGLGRRLGELAVPPTTAKGYEGLISWAEDFGQVGSAGVEGTSSYGAGLTRHLRAAGIGVFEVERPKRRHLRRKGNSDSRDAEAAARAVLAGETAGEPKSGDGRVQMIRVLRAARRSAVKARTQAANQLRGVRVTAPEALRRRLRGLSTKELVAAAARFRPGGDPGEPGGSGHQVRPSLGGPTLPGPLRGDRRARRSARSSGSRDRSRAYLSAGRGYGPRRDAPGGRGGQPRTAGQRGVFRQPLRRLARGSLLRQSGEASSQPWRQPGRQPRPAPYLCVVRMRIDERTRRYAARRASEGKSKKEIIRCLKRYVAREVYRVLATSVAFADSSVDNGRTVAVTGVTRHIGASLLGLA